MNTKRLAISFLGVFVFIFLFEFLYHGKLLMGMYEQTAHLWRPKEESNMLFILLSQLFFSAMVSYIFTLNYEGKGLGEGIRYGLLVGLLVGSIQVGTYCYMPIPLTLTLAWVLSEVIKGVGAGVILSFTYKK